MSKKGYAVTVKWVHDYGYGYPFINGYGYGYPFINGYGYGVPVNAITDG